MIIINYYVLIIIQHFENIPYLNIIVITKN